MLCLLLFCFSYEKPPRESKEEATHSQRDALKAARGGCVHPGNGVQGLVSAALKLWPALGGQAEETKEREPQCLTGKSQAVKAGEEEGSSREEGGSWRSQRQPQEVAKRSNSLWTPLQETATQGLHLHCKRMLCFILMNTSAPSQDTYLTFVRSL